MSQEQLASATRVVKRLKLVLAQLAGQGAAGRVDPGGQRGDADEIEDPIEAMLTQHLPAAVDQHSQTHARLSDKRLQRLAEGILDLSYLQAVHSPPPSSRASWSAARRTARRA